MSIDYPDREVWLAQRTKLKQPMRYMHVSGAAVSGAAVSGAASEAAMNDRTFPTFSHHIAFLAGDDLARRKRLMAIAREFGDREGILRSLARAANRSYLRNIKLMREYANKGM